LDASVIEDLRCLQRPGQPDVYLGLVELFLETATLSAKAVNNSAISRNLVELDDAAHSLKSSAAIVGALRLSEFCSALEAIGNGRSPIDDLDSLLNAFNDEFKVIDRALNALIDKA
jgi:HPt (histidine-containing phosphotransfer) domain-containing protein